MSAVLVEHPGPSHMRSGRKPAECASAAGRGARPIDSYHVDGFVIVRPFVVVIVDGN
jgi:hypothetical protein